MHTHNTDHAPNAAAGRTGSPVDVAQWWKAWVLMGSLGISVLGWMTLSFHEPAPAGGAIAAPMATADETVAVAPAAPVVRPRQASAAIRALPGMPTRPVFQAPITRTRRS